MNPYSDAHKPPAAPRRAFAKAVAQTASGIGKKRRDEPDHVREQPGDDSPHDSGFDPLNPDAPPKPPAPAS
jgi:hypothetical protein